MRKIWHDEAWEEYLYWQEQDKKTLRRINKILKDIDRNDLIVESISMRYIGKNSFLLLLDSFVAFATNESHILYTIDFVRRI